MELRDVEIALAAEAAAHARAALELNPYLDAEARELGSAWLVYAGTFSPVHGVFGLGLDGPIEERDWDEIHRFFQRKEREPYYWTTPFTDPSVLEGLARTHRATRVVSVHGIDLAAAPATAMPEGSSTPEHGAWSLAFARRENPARTEADLFALTKLHQKETRFYLHGEAASYTFFSRGIALIPPVDLRTLPLQQREAEEFKSTALITLNDSTYPKLYERTLHEPV